MRSEYESVQTAKGTQEDEMRALKDRMLLGVSAELLLGVTEILSEKKH